MGVVPSAGKHLEIKPNNPLEVRILGICDSHFSAHTPASYKIDYWSQCKDLLRQVRTFAISKKVDLVLWGGDVFHLKTPTRNPLWFVSELAEELNSFGIPHAGVAGNHDLKFGSLTGLKGQPLELFVKTGLFKLLDEGDITLLADDFELRVAGESYNHGKAEGTRDKKKGTSDFLLSVGHFWFGSSTGEFFGEPLYAPDFLDKGEADAYLIGHHHDDQGIVPFNGKKYVACGSMGRTGAHKGDLERRLAASYITVTEKGVDVKVLRPKFIPSAEALDLEKRVAIMKEDQELLEFVDSLNQADLSGGSPEDILEGMDVLKEVKDRARLYLEQAEAK